MINYPALLMWDAEDIVAFVVLFPSDSTKTICIAYGKTECIKAGFCTIESEDSRCKEKTLVVWVCGQEQDASVAIASREMASVVRQGQEEDEDRKHNDDECCSHACA
jgi:hypothetical protein